MIALVLCVITKVFEYVKSAYCGTEPSREVISRNKRQRKKYRRRRRRRGKNILSFYVTNKSVMLIKTK